MRNPRFISVPLFFCLLLLAGCATTGKDADPSGISDPIEPVNRAIFSFNMFIDDYVYEPVVKAYRFVTPEVFRDVVHNFLSHLAEPLSAINSALQGNFEGTAGSVIRFSFNTVFGVFGAFDAAEQIGLPKDPQTFGDTLGVWGLAEGPYVVVPFVSGVFMRDLAGFGADWYANPLGFKHYYSPYAYARNMDGISAWTWTLSGFNVLDTRYQNDAILMEIKKTSLDPYSTYRDMVFNHRKNTLNRRRHQGADSPPAPMNYDFDIPDDDYEEEEPPL